MLLSQLFDGKTEGGDWFDVLLGSDTPLFVDPFLIYKEADGRWAGAHDELITHFDEVFKTLAKSGGNVKSPYYIKAVASLVFHEPEEFCLGYTAIGTRGAGGGWELAAGIARAMQAAIKRGIKHLDHFELLGVFNTGIGPDRIGDLTCTILKRHFISYTADVAAKHGWDTEEWEVPVGPNNSESVTAHLPTNPASEDPQPVLLVPKRFLRRLPTLYAEDWWEWHVHRAELNIDVLEGVNKTEIVAEALKHQQAVTDWVGEREGGEASPYDVDADPDLVWRWDPITADWVASNQVNLKPFRRVDRFHKLIDLVIAQYRQFIETEAGWRLLWNDDGTEKYEDAAQSLFRGIAKHYCHANDIAIDREVNLGRGPVDFKFSKGREYVADLEVKKLHNGAFWTGLNKQLVEYMEADETKDGWLLAIQLRSDGVSKQRIKDLPEAVKNVSKEKGLNLRYGVIDGRRRKSASKK
jgi:hypothetical protein